MMKTVKDRRMEVVGMMTFVNMMSLGDDAMEMGKKFQGMTAASMVIQLAESMY